MSDSIYLSIIVPSYKSAGILRKNLPVLITYLKSQDYSFEVIVVDDGSNDHGATETVCHEMNCIFCRNKKNIGKGAAVRTGMKAARGAFRIFTDADIPYELNAIGTMLRYLDFKEFQLVIGDRKLKGSSYLTEIPELRKITSIFFTRFVGTIVTANFFDTQCGLKGFRGDVADFIFKHARINGFAFDVELLYIALKQNFEIKRIPVRLTNQEKSTVKVFRHGVGMFFDLFRIKLNNMRGYYKG
ncbi:MAG: glycosyltransferase [Bacteroidales bacterium]|nr:glycosyltransferase [Bacteroidales bacterium]MDD4603503.1 glycosyltransferase [Bacteroidales bacterium]